MKKSWKDMKLEVLRNKYEKLVDSWEDKGDDRRLFCNTYKMIVHAIGTLPANPDNYVRVAMNRMILEDEKMMDRIAGRFSW